jgi:hypothetical protein
MARRRTRRIKKRHGGSRKHRRTYNNRVKRGGDDNQQKPQYTCEDMQTLKYQYNKAATECNRKSNVGAECDERIRISAILDPLEETCPTGGRRRKY